MLNRHQISISTITDYHLESFIRCPYQFYYQHVQSVNTNQVKWRQVVQYIVNQTVQSFCKLAESEQNKLAILKLIDQHWQNVHVQLFDSKTHYYTVLAKTTDHLLQFLSVNKSREQPLFLFEKLNTYIDELETHLSLTFELAEWSYNSFTIKKFLVEGDSELITLYNHLMVVFSYEAFGKIPERIEIINLMKGETYTYTPTLSSVSEGLSYLKYMKNLLQEPNEYINRGSIPECENCPITVHCKTKSNDDKDSSTINFFH